MMKVYAKSAPSCGTPPTTVLLFVSSDVLIPQCLLSISTANHLQCHFIDIRERIDLSNPILTGTFLFCLRLQANNEKSRTTPPSLSTTAHVVLAYRHRAKQIDQISRVAFPIGFFLFNALYWPYYMF